MSHSEFRPAVLFSDGASVSIRRRPGDLLAVFSVCLSAPVLLIGTGAWLGWLSWWRPLMLPDEGRYAGVAWDMYRSGTMGVPLLNGMPYFHKPPLYYWLAEIAYRLLGVNEWAARMPSWLGAWATVAAVYLFAARYGERGTARVAVAILATLPLFYGGAQFANMDMLVAGTITLATLAGASAVLEQRAGRSHAALMLAAGVFAALALLSKGLIGVVLPLGILLAWLLADRQWKSLRVLLWPPAIVVFLALGLPWFVWMQLRYPGFFHYFFIYQQFDRFTETEFNNVQPFWFYLPVLLGLSLPWALWGRGLFRKAFWAASPARSVRLLLAVWIAVVVGFFSLPSSKLVGYILPALPPLAMLLAGQLRPALAIPAPATRRAAAAALGVAMLACVLAVALTAVYGKFGAKSLAGPYAARMGPDDTIVALQSYPFDIAFYTRADRPIWVVDDWEKFGSDMRDDWRKELMDAAGFAPAVGKQTLVASGQLTQRMCAVPSGTFWFWGESGDGARYDVLRGILPLASQGRRALWRVPADAAFRADHCAAAPSAR